MSPHVSDCGCCARNATLKGHCPPRKRFGHIFLFQTETMYLSPVFLLSSSVFALQGHLNYCPHCAFPIAAEFEPPHPLMSRPLGCFVELAAVLASPPPFIPGSLRRIPALGGRLFLLKTTEMRQQTKNIPLSLIYLLLAWRASLTFLLILITQNAKSSLQTAAAFRSPLMWSFRYLTRMFED